MGKLKLDFVSPEILNRLQGFHLLFARGANGLIVEEVVKAFRDCCPIDGSAGSELRVLQSKRVGLPIRRNLVALRQQRHDLAFTVYPQQSFIHVIEQRIGDRCRIVMRGI